MTALIRVATEGGIKQDIVWVTVLSHIEKECDMRAIPLEIV